MTDLVRTVEVAEALGKRATAETVEREATELGMYVRRTWKGEAAVTGDDAKALLDGSARATQEHEQRWREHVAAEKAWVEARTAAGVEAAERVRARHVGPRDGETWSKENGAALAAVRKFERSHPRPRFPGLAPGKVSYP